MGSKKRLSPKSNIDRKVEMFFEKNPKIKEALESYKMSEDQYLKVVRSMEPQISTSNKLLLDC